MKFGSLFTGVGGFDLGFERAGMECAWQVEQDKYCNQVLERHWPEVRRYRDVREVGRNNLEPVDLICGGFPCQDISYSGKGAGIDGKRSGLWHEMYRIICEIRPRFVLVENVSALLDRGMGVVLGDLAAGGYDAEWDVLPAKAFGAPHTRERVFIIAYANGERCGDTPQRHGSLRLLKRIPEREAWLSKLPESAICGIDDGVPNRVDRLRALGNAVVPQVAEYIGRSIMEVDNEIKNMHSM